MNPQALHHPPGRTVPSPLHCTMARVNTASTMKSNPVLIYRWYKGDLNQRGVQRDPVTLGAAARAAWEAGKGLGRRKGWTQV